MMFPISSVGIIRNVENKICESLRYKNSIQMPNKNKWICVLLLFGNTQMAFCVFFLQWRLSHILLSTFPVVSVEEWGFITPENSSIVVVHFLRLLTTNFNVFHLSHYLK